jgi:hypothetical protein
VNKIGETHYLSCAETAKLVRQALKAAFPGVKFSVRSHTYSMGANISVNWTDGPTEAAVNAITDGYRSVDFDGMTDSTTHRPTTLIALPDGSVEDVHFGAHYIHGTRDLSPAYVAQLEVHAAAAIERDTATCQYGWSLDTYYPCDLWTDFGSLYGPCNGHQVVRFLSQHIEPATADA